MRKVIVNSTPLIALGKTNLLGLLKELYGEITVPAAVYSEVTAKNDIVRRSIEEAEWIHVETVRDERDLHMYRAKLHAGEVEVMVLAQKCEGEHLVIIDDDAARKTAQYLGLTMTGTIGVLIKAKELGYIELVMPVIEKMELNQIYFSEDLKARIRRIAKE